MIFIPKANSINVDLSKNGKDDNSFNLRYEPSNVVESKGLLKVSSPDGGEYLDEYDDYINNTYEKIINIFLSTAKLYDEH